MKIFRILLLIISFPLFVSGQHDTSHVRRVGAIGSFDLSYNFPDKLLNPGFTRRLSAGVSFTNKKADFVAFVAVGLKGAKITAYSPTFNQSFLDDVKQSYVPVVSGGLDSLVGHQMSYNGGQGFTNSYSQYIHLGCIWNKTKWRPQLSFYVGNEDYLLYGPGFSKYTDPENGDIRYVGMKAVFYELKLGCAIPFRAFAKQSYGLNVHLGYKWMDFGTMNFDDTPLSIYTTGDLAAKYNKTENLTLSLSFMFWSNWK